MAGWIFRIAIALLIIAVIVRFGFASMRSYVRGADQEAADRKSGQYVVDIEDDDIRYRCVNCGFEIRVLRVPALEEGEALPPVRHCREDMELST